MTRPKTSFVAAVCVLIFAHTGQAQDKCAALASVNSAQLPNATTMIGTAVLKSPSPAVKGPAGRGDVPALPEHCEVVGKMNDRMGANGQHYAIRFHMRLPSAWNGRFFFEGGGGSNGNIGDALGNLQGQQPTNALVLGYAVVSQDSGHDNAVNNDPKLNGAQTFGFDEQALLDFGYNSYDQVTQVAKALIKIYYGRPPERSYYVGCSEGGARSDDDVAAFSRLLRRHSGVLSGIQTAEGRRRRGLGYAGVCRCGEGFRA